MRKGLFKRSIIFLFVQALIIFTILELGFRVSAFVKTRLLNPSTIKTKGIFVVLCVGDSTTEGLTEPAQYSYPAQLQTLLNEHVKGKKFKVINIGYGGMNSSQVLNRFKANLLKYHPDLVVLLIGINDSWNMNESNIWMFDKSSGLRKLRLKTALLLSKVKVYQFIKLIMLSRRILKLEEFDEKRHLVAKSFERSQERRSQLFNLLFYNISEIVKLAKNYNIKIFLQTYQKEGRGNTRMLINKVYENLDVPLVDNQAIFEEAQLRGLTVIAHDNFHPNRIGYSLIARNVFNLMVKEGLIESSPL